MKTLKKIKKLKKQSKSKINKNLWSKISKSMREARGDKGCEICQRTTNLQVHHIVSKYFHKSILRFEPSNLLVCCPKCHFLFHKNPISTMDWFARNRRVDYQKILDILGRINEV